ncbi:gliding motility-associated C-terminal domain-containing protein [Mucilaginibacter flavidus]|uniref:gliding motility-associated C-terminal domain-containing protein n=1 Tax=Mucilaginibacter flavidus TaxID=2949309 RepID=UPI00209266A0|nr:gliding motility-associated C-terminal domain-containing protein [Mucilaginibacter flavidus]MCO5946269.1 gliding motility-associated C-terminal domain-containing protein [Mucilaginibacter flavidus]
MILIEQINLKVFYIDMTNKGMRFLTLLAFFMSVCFCADAGYLKPLNVVAVKKKPAAPAIISFKIPQQIAAEVIDETNHSIGIAVHAGQNLTALVPTIITNPATAVVSPASGAPQDFTNAVGYTLDVNQAFYSVNVLRARSAAPICSGTSATLTGDPPPPGSGTYKWQILNQATGAWTYALGVNTGADYTTATLTSNANAPKLYTFRRSIIIGAFTAYDSYTDLTVNQTTVISNNTITQPPLNTFCASGDMAIIPGSVPSGGNGNYTYQWQSSTDGGSTFGDISGATNPDYDPPTVTVTTIYQRIVTSGTCTPAKKSNTVKVTILNAITNNMLFSPATTSFCIKSTPFIINGNIPNGGTGTFKYQWQSSPDGVTFTDITGAISQDYHGPVINTTTYYRRMVTSGACSTPVPSAQVITITIQPGLGNFGITAPAITTFCGSGDPVVIIGNAATGGNGFYNYQWQSSPDGGTFNDIPGATNQDYDPGLLTATTYYQRTVTSGACSTPLKSNAIVITIQPALSANTINPTGAITFCATGDPAVINGSAVTGGNGTPGYQWESSPDGNTYQPVNGATNQNYDPVPITQTTYYRRTVTSGTCVTPSVSAPVVITIQPALSANTVTPSGATIFCANGDPVVINGNVVTGGSGTPVYQWESSQDGNTYLPINGATNQNYDPLPITQTTYYRRTVTSGSCVTTSVSAPVVITIQPALSANTITPSGATTFCATGDPTVINGNVVTGGSGIPLYQWESSPDGNTYQPINGATNQNYDPLPITQTTYYHRTVTSGSCSIPSISAPVVITIQPALVGNTLTPPATTQFCGPGDAGVITGSTPTGGDGSPLYQWQQSPDNVDAHFTDINGQTGKDFDPPSLTTTMFYRRVVISAICSTPLISAAIEIHITQPITSNTILVPPFPYCVSVDPQPISGSPPNGGDGPNSFQYKWYSSTDKGATWILIPGANSIDYDPSTITVTTSYRRDVTSGACQVPLQSAMATITVNQTPANAVINTITPICAGNTTTISITSPDPALTYVWYDSPDKSNAVFQGTSFVTQVLNATQTYYVEASNGTCASPVLTPATVTVNTVPAAPVLQTNPVSTCAGSPAILNILTPQAGLTYNWYTAATGGTSVFTGPDFTTPVLSNNTTYYVDATSSSGCTSTSRTVVNVSAIPLPTISAQGANVCPGDPATLVSNNTDLDVTVNWYASATGGAILFTGNSVTTPPINANTSYYAEAVNNSCSSAARAKADVQIIQPLPAPVPQAIALKAPNITFEWSPVSGADGYLVSTDNRQTFTAPSSGSNGNTHTVTGLQIGQSVTLIVRATGDVSCKESANSTQVTALAVNPLIDQVFVANAFTPNGDGKNDVVYVHNENIKTLKFYVYSQWGELLFMSQSQQNGWDGTFKGKAEPAGVYVYYVEITLTNGEKVNKKGTITLLR